MAGLYQNNSAQKHEAIIRDWIADASTKDGFERYDDLHIDRIDPRWRAQGSWIEAGFNALNIASTICSDEEVRLTVVLAFSLEPAHIARGAVFGSAEEIVAEFSQTPPSLYLFRPGLEPWSQQALQKSPVEADIRIQEVDSKVFGDIGRIRRCLCMQFRYQDEGYLRSLFVF